MGARQFIHDEKIRISRTEITKFQYQERWPENYNSYVGLVRKSNLFKDPETFFRVMHFKPQLYAKDFTFLPIRNVTEELAEATRLANSIIFQQTSSYVTQPGSESTGHYKSRFKFLLDGREIRNFDQFNNADDNSVVNIYNTALYAGTIEKNALYFTRIGGVMFYAAQRLKKAYPSLGVRFVYWRAKSLPDVSHLYDVPVLSIGSRAAVSDEIKRPGRNHRTTGRRIRRRARGVNN